MRIMNSVDPFTLDPVSEEAQFLIPIEGITPPACHAFECESLIKYAVTSEDARNPFTRQELPMARLRCEYFEREDARPIPYVRSGATFWLRATDPIVTELDAVRMIWCIRVISSVFSVTDHAVRFSEADHILFLCYFALNVLPKVSFILQMLNHRCPREASACAMAMMHHEHTSAPISQVVHKMVAEAIREVFRSHETNSK